MIGKEALGISSVVRKLILFYPPNILVNLERELLQKYLEQLVSLTCGFLRTSAAQAGDEEERILFNEVRSGNNCKPRQLSFSFIFIHSCTYGNE